MRTRTVLLTLAALLIAGGAVLLTRRGPTPVPVDISTVTRVATLRSFVSASGEITAVRNADIGSSLMGRLVELRVKEGDQVKAGEVLAIIDPEQASSTSTAAAAAVEALEAEGGAAASGVRVAQANLDAARARVEDTARTLTRLRTLRTDGLVSQMDLDSAQAAADAAQAQMASATAELRRAEQGVDVSGRRAAQARADARRARDTLAQTRIASPIRGTVTRLDVEQGEMVVMGVQNQPGTILMRVSDLSAIDAEVKVAEADVLRLALDDRATVTLEALPGESFSGRVVEIGASALPQLGTQAAAREFRVLVRLDRGTERLRPGLTADVEILVETRANALVAPLQSVIERAVGAEASRLGVFVVDNGVVRFTPLARTGIIGGLQIEVDGVAEGATIVAGPFQTLRELRDGDRVQPASSD